MAVKIIRITADTELSGHGKISVMTMPPFDESEPQAWMMIEDVFHIKGRGTVVTGQLQGSVPVSIGDTLFCEGQRWPVSGIEQFRKVLSTVDPGSHVGILLSKAPAAAALRGRMAMFETKAAARSGSGLDPADQKKRRWRH